MRPRVSADVSARKKSALTLYQSNLKGVSKVKTSESHLDFASFLVSRSRVQLNISYAYYFSGKQLILNRTLQNSYTCLFNTHFKN